MTAKLFESLIMMNVMFKVNLHKFTVILLSSLYLDLHMILSIITKYYDT